MLRQPAEQNETTMSYILEALKKSQQQRELGQVPRIEENWLEQLPDRAPPHPWVIGSAVLALVALAIALYAVLRSGPEVVVPVTVPEVSPAPAAVLPQTDVATVQQDTMPVPLALEDPADLSVAPNLLIVPAPDPSGGPLPRGADEIRRAVLGEGLSPSVQTAAGASGEAQLQIPADLPSEEAIPEDLRAEIEAFKQQVRTGGDPPPRRSSSIPEPAIPLVVSPTVVTPAADPSPELRQRLPPLSISVHVYRPSPAERFVYLNGSKMHEQEVTPEGLRIEEITEAGVILSYQGEQFFERR